MKRGYLGVALLMLTALGLAACGSAAPKASKIEPAKVERVGQTDFSRVVLTEEAVRRTAIQTAQVVDGQGAQKVIPYSSVIYDLNGATWAYTSPEPRTFIRQSITVERIDGDKAFLSQGPPAGTAVVSVGAAELYGAEFGVGK